MGSDFPLTTLVQIPPLQPPLRKQSRLFSMGSCFSDVIGRYWQDCLLPCCHNPFGILFNPLSILRSLQLLQQPEFSIRNLPERLVFDGHLYHSLDFHGDFSGPDQKQCLVRMTEAIQTAADFLKTADCLILTWGSSKVWFHRQNPALPAANCHRLPAADFTCRTIDCDEITASYRQFFTEYFQQHPRLRVILTVSPVRHIRQGAVENQRCKARLLLAAEKLTEIFPDQFYYFPSYEILLDELRDYRFFSEDFCHPSPLAEQYIRQKFINSCTAPELQRYFPAAEKYIRAASHRPVHPDSPEYAEFLKKLMQMREELIRLQ